MNQEHTDAPACYRRADSQAVAAWYHEDTQTVVKVERWQRPTQMRDPRTATDDVSYRVVVRDPDVNRGEIVAKNYADAELAHERAVKWMDEHPDGQLPQGKGGRICQ